MNFSLTRQEWRKAAIFRIWHGLCEYPCIGGMTRRMRQIGEFEMSKISYYMRHVMAAAAALFISGTLMVNSLAVSAHEVHSVAGILA